MRTRIMGVLGVVAAITMAGCGDGDDSRPLFSVPADAAVFTGTYDVRFFGLARPLTAAGVGSVRGDGRDLHVTLYPPSVATVQLAGTIAADGTVLRVSATASESDYVFEVAIDATAVRVEDRMEIVGNARAKDGLDHLMAPFRFEMVRRLGARANAYAGAWTFEFPASPGTCQCSSTAHVSIDLSDPDEGATGEATETNAAGAVVGLLHAGSALVSPGGYVRLSMLYGTPTAETCAVGSFLDVLEHPPPCGLTLSGVLGERKGRGGAEIFGGPFWSSFGSVDWSATRTAEPPG